MKPFKSSAMEQASAKALKEVEGVKRALKNQVLCSSGMPIPISDPCPHCGATDTEVCRLPASNNRTEA